MKDHVSAALSPSNRRFMFLEAIGASFMVCFVVFGVLVCIEIRDLRSELRTMEVTCMPKSPDSTGGHYLIDDDPEDTDERSAEDIDYYGIPDWVPSFPAHNPAAKASGSAGQNETLSRVRRADGRKCVGCCRECDCESKKKRNVKSSRSCEQCCQRCVCERRKKMRNAKSLNSIFHDRLGHFIGFINNSASGDKRKWEYAKWMKSGAKGLYKLRRNGEVIVNEAGMYYLYGQLIVRDSKPIAGIGLMIEETTDSRQLTKCLETAGYLRGKGGIIADGTGTFRSCNMGAMTELQEDAVVYLKVHGPNGSPVTTVHNANTAYFGIIKYT